MIIRVGLPVLSARDLFSSAPRPQARSSLSLAHSENLISRADRRDNRDAKRRVLQRRRQFHQSRRFRDATLDYPGPGSPAALPLVNSTDFGISPGFPTQAAMDAAYPIGSYVFNFSGGSMGPASETVSYTVDASTADVPQLAAASFNALLGLSTSLSSLTLNFNSFTPSSNALEAFTFFTIFGSSQTCGFLDPSATVARSTRGRSRPERLTTGSSISAIKSTTSWAAWTCIPISTSGPTEPSPRRRSPRHRRGRWRFSASRGWASSPDAACGRARSPEAGPNKNEKAGGRLRAVFFFYIVLTC